MMYGNRHLLLLGIIVAVCALVEYTTVEASPIPDEKWGYVTVRPRAHMFWWVYGAHNKAARSSLPLILWLQGGPGGSGTGFGNFFEIGPYGMNDKPRSTTWLTKANVLFIDNPVGTGFSYVDDLRALTTDVSQIADDLFVIFSAILKEIPAFKQTPFYVFCESYGGKMTAAFGERLHQGIQQGQIDCNFKGVALGDSWISPVDSVMTWGPYLYQFNLLDEKDLKAVMAISERVEQAVNKGQYETATKLWQQTEDVIDQKTDYVNCYNVLQHRAPPFPQKYNSSNDHVGRLYQRHVAVYQSESLGHFMNNKIRSKLGVIPKHVQWGGQADAVFRAQNVDFMKPVIKTVDKLIAHGYKVVVFQGQLDMICDTPGAERWIKKFTWPHLGYYLATSRKPLYVKSKGGNTQGFVKSHENFSLYYIMNAGHMVPADNGEMALKMVGFVVNV